MDKTGSSFCNLTVVTIQFLSYDNTPFSGKEMSQISQATLDMSLTFSGSIGLVLEAFSDANWGAGENRKSISGFIFLLAGAAICWQSRKQSTVALSSTEAEYIALVQAAKELLWIQQLLENL